jgi:hypothetical protein
MRMMAQKFKRLINFLQLSYTMNKILKYLGYAIIIYVFLWIFYMTFVSLKIYFDKYGYPLFLKFLANK